MFRKNNLDKKRGSLNCTLTNAKAAYQKSIANYYHTNPTPTGEYQLLTVLHTSYWKGKTLNNKYKYICKHLQDCSEFVKI